MTNGVSGCSVSRIRKADEASPEEEECILFINFTLDKSSEKRYNEIMGLREEVMKNQMVVLICLTFVLILGIDACSTSRIIEGIAVDQDGNRISGISIHIRVANTGEIIQKEVKTDENGEYRIQLAPNQYQVTFEKENLSAKKEIRLDIREKDDSNRTIVLPLLSALEGVVQNDSGKGIPQVAITLRNTKTFSGPTEYTKADGTFLIPVLEEGEYRLIVDHPNYYVSQPVQLLYLKKGDKSTKIITLKSISRINPNAPPKKKHATITVEEKGGGRLD